MFLQCDAELGMFQQSGHVHTGVSFSFLMAALGEFFFGVFFRIFSLRSVPKLGSLDKVLRKTILLIPRLFH